MLFSKLSIALIASATLSTAFSIPEGSPDGLYIHEYDTTGKETTTYVGVLNDTVDTMSKIPWPPRAKRVAGVPSPAKRAATGSYCQSGSSSDVSAADQGLVNLCGGGYSFGTAVSYASGGAVAYGCNYGNGQTCHADDIAGFFAELDADCGASQFSWYSKDEWKASYGRTSNGGSFC